MANHELNNTDTNILDALVEILNAEGIPSATFSKNPDPSAIAVRLVNYTLVLYNGVIALYRINNKEYQTKAEVSFDISDPNSIDNLIQYLKSRKNQ